jgi:hypothetical protein
VAGSSKPPQIDTGGAASVWFLRKAVNFGPGQAFNQFKRRLQMRKLLVLLSVLGLAGTLYAADSFTGTWKLDTAKSKYESGPAPKEVTLMVQEGKDTNDVTVKGTDGSGKPLATHLTHPTHGGPVTFSEGGPTDGSTESVKIVGANSRHVTTMQNGKEVETEQITLSADGKTIREVTKGTLPSGKPFTDVAIYEKQ